MKTYSEKNLYIIIYSSFIQNSEKLEITETSFNGWIVKQTMAHHTVEYYSVGKKLLPWRLLLSKDKSIWMQTVYSQQNKGIWLHH